MINKERIKDRMTITDNEKVYRQGVGISQRDRRVDVAVNEPINDKKEYKWNV